jgi:hypothetical protein
MALELKIAVSSIAEDGKRITITDTTGTYHATDNLTGYGAPNELRENLNVVLLSDSIAARHRASVSSSENTAQAPGTAKEWDIALSKDCLYEFLIVGAKPPVVSQAYSIDNVVYDNGALYKSLASQTYTGLAELSDCKKWKKISLVTDFPMLADNSAYHAMLPYVHTALTEICKANKAIEMSQAGTESLDFEYMAKGFLWAEVNYLASKYSAAWGDMIEAGEAIEEASQACTNFNHVC